MIEIVPSIKQHLEQAKKWELVQAYKWQILDFFSS
jgi:hypothetical protein